MKNSRLTAIVTIAALSVALTACSGNEANPTLEDGAKTAKSTAVAEVTMSKETEKSVETVGVEETDELSDEPPKPGTYLWKEVPIRENKVEVLVEREEFDLRRIITGGDYIFDYNFNTFDFSGTIVGIKEYEHSWASEDGAQFGPFRRSILEVKISNVYNGKSPVDGDIIKIFNSDSVSDIYSNAPEIKEGCEYVFVGCWVLDEKYTEYNRKYYPDSVNRGLEEYADVRITAGTWESLFPIENGKVIVNSGYFVHDENAKSKIFSLDSTKTDMMAYVGWDSYSAMNLSDFEEEFLKLFENPENLPTVEEQD